MHVYTPWWLNDAKLDFLRGYHLEIWGGLEHILWGFGLISTTTDLAGD